MTALYSSAAHCKNAELHWQISSSVGFICPNTKTVSIFEIYNFWFEDFITSDDKSFGSFVNFGMCNGFRIELSTAFFEAICLCSQFLIVDIHKILRLQSVFSLVSGLYFLALELYKKKIFPLVCGLFSPWFSGFQSQEDGVFSKKLQVLLLSWVTYLEKWYAN